MQNIKLWQRVSFRDKSSLVEIKCFDELDKRRPLALCMPGMSTTHDNARSINGFMSLVDKSISFYDKKTKPNIFSVSYNSSEEQKKCIGRYNDDPLTYYSDGAKEFAKEICAQLIACNLNVNLFCKSFGSVFAGMVINALFDLGVEPDPSQIRILSIGNVARVNFSKRKMATEFIIEGSNDRKAAKLNGYKQAAPRNHKAITITQLHENCIHILATLRDRVIVEKSSGEEIVSDPERHTVLLYFASNPFLRELIKRISLNMLKLKNRDFSVEKSFISSFEMYEGGDLNLRKMNDCFALAFQRGTENKKVRGVFIDWDLTLADGERVNLNALNTTFRHMRNLSSDVQITKTWTMQDMRLYFLPTVPSFFKNLYGDNANHAIRIFCKERKLGIDKVKLLKGTKEFLRCLLKHGVSVAIVSNKDEMELKRQVDVLLPEPEFRDILVVGYSSYLKAKPHPDQIYHASNYFGIRKNELPSVVFVGDRYDTDVRASYEAGCRSCLLGDLDKDVLFKNSKKIIFSDENRSKIVDAKGREVLHFSCLNSLAKHIDNVSNDGFRHGFMALEMYE